MQSVLGEGAVSLTTDVRRLMTALQRTYAVRKTNGGHWCVLAPQGPVFVASSPSDKRAWRNIVSQLKRKGVVLP